MKQDGHRGYTVHDPNTGGPSLEAPEQSHGRTKWVAVAREEEDDQPCSVGARVCWDGTTVSPGLHETQLHT